LDIADYLLKFALEDFSTVATNVIEHTPIEQPPAVQPLVEASSFSIIENTNFNKLDNPKHENWERDIAELENYFGTIAIPTQTIRLNQNTIITDISKFIDTNLAVVKAYNGKPIFLPYLNRLKELKAKLLSAF
jgi:hypothetical protein